MKHASDGESQDTMAVLNRVQRMLLLLFSILTVFLWAAIIFNYIRANNFGSIVASISVGLIFSLSSFVSSRGLDWDLLTKSYRKLNYDVIFAPGDKITSHWAVSRLLHLLFFSTVILLLADNSVISGQNWLIALTTATTIVTIEVVLEFITSKDNRDVEIVAPYSYTYAGVSKRPRTLGEIQQSGEESQTESTVKSNLVELEKSGHIESKKVSGEKVWWIKQ
ncbi:hypothetical protein [Halorubrum sodomense]|uniref:hypothetical protein n=1 Tax=Halorubrum sodomense TaxID=35743 RepID=UPI0011608E56|nr:hypothetical protein [Halorubrum sodomense]